MRRIANLFLGRDSRPPTKQAGTRTSQNKPKNINVIPDVKPRIDTKNPFQNIILNGRSCRAKSDLNMCYSKTNKSRSNMLMECSRSQTSSKRSIRKVCLPTTTTTRNIAMPKGQIAQQNYNQRSFKRRVSTRSQFIKNPPSSVTKHLQNNKNSMKPQAKLVNIKKCIQISSKLRIRTRSQCLVKSENNIQKSELKEAQGPISDKEINCEKNNIQHLGGHGLRIRSQRIKNRIENSKYETNLEAEKNAQAVIKKASKRGSATEISSKTENNYISNSSKPTASKAAVTTRSKCMQNISIENHRAEQREANGKLEKKKVEKSPLRKIKKASNKTRRKFTFKTMINTSIREIAQSKPNGGVSYYAIKEYLAKKYFIDVNKSKNQIKKIILNQMELGELVRLKGKTVWGTYRIPTKFDKKKINAKKRQPKILNKMNKTTKKQTPKINLKRFNMKKEPI